jgi:hypothetical protein
MTYRSDPLHTRIPVLHPAKVPRVIRVLEKFEVEELGFRSNGIKTTLEFYEELVHVRGCDPNLYVEGALLECHRSC